MNRFSIALAGLIGVTTSASAADMSDYAPFNAPSEPTIWTGFYAGVSLGGAHSDGEAERGYYTGEPLTTDVGNGLFPGDIDGDEWGVIGGVQVGYNHQFGNFVAGAEADFSFTDLNILNRYQRIDPSPTFPYTGTDTRTSYSTDIENLGTVRARFGYASGPTLAYVSGGLAYGKVTNKFNLDLTFPLLNGAEYPRDLGGIGRWSEEDWSAGYAIGGGVEHKFTEAFSLKAELFYVDLEDTKIKVTDPVFPGNQIDYHFDNDLVIGRIGLNYAF